MGVSAAEPNKSSVKTVEDRGNSDESVSTIGCPLAPSGNAKDAGFLQDGVVESHGFGRGSVGAGSGSLGTGRGSVGAGRGSSGAGRGFSVGAGRGSSVGSRGAGKNDVERVVRLKPAPESGKAELRLKMKAGGGDRGGDGESEGSSGRKSGEKR